MKVFIWISIMLVGSALNLLIGYTTGFKFGPVILYIVYVFLARHLCSRWDEYKEKKRLKEQQTTAVTSDDSIAIFRDESRDRNPKTSDSTKTLTPPQPSFCRRCGNPLHQGEVFCGCCGTKIVTGE